ncbi:uncharacterized protein LOC142353152 [Convolutriloba macropyga]|uniref:uncharacterized protein LOC142353152 n=1 Tax=Convolutriloba macropyga TaxID=536237 RepID=UPI003F527152
MVDARSILLLSFCFLVKNLKFSRSYHQEPDHCPYVSAVPLILEKFLGRWYPVMTANNPGKRGSDDPCLVVDLFLLKASYGWFLQMNVTSYDNQTFSTAEIICQKAIPYPMSNLGSFIMDSEGRLPTIEQPNIFVVYLDHLFTVIFHCRIDRHGSKQSGSWVLSREQKPNPFSLRVLHWKMIDMGIFLPQRRVPLQNCPKFSRGNLKELTAGKEEKTKGARLVMRPKL